MRLVIGPMDPPLPAPGCRLSQWSGDPERCRWCDGPARPGTPWCSLVCEDAHGMNHRWDLARSAALARDHERCGECGRGPRTLTEARLLLRVLIPMGPVEAARLWRTEAWWALELACSVDVVHRDGWPAAGYRAGCHHHLDVLEIRCHSCTAAAGRVRRPA